MLLYSAYLAGAFFIYAGIMHFKSPGFFLKIMPPYLPLHKEAVFWSGVFEVLLGLMLFFDFSRSWAVIGLIILLILVFPANIYMAFDPKFLKIPAWIRYGRLPLQIAGIYWMYKIYEMANV
jgi:uncharacterized membrane protein